jgi:hypothetical protein
LRTRSAIPASLLDRHKKFVARRTRSTAILGQLRAVARCAAPLTEMSLQPKKARNDEEGDFARFAEVRDIH